MEKEGRGGGFVILVVVVAVGWGFRVGWWLPSKKRGRRDFLKIRVSNEEWVISVGVV